MHLNIESHVAPIYRRSLPIKKPMSGHGVASLGTCVFTKWLSVNKNKGYQYYWPFLYLADNKRFLVNAIMKEENL